MENPKIVQIPSEFKRLFDKDWREAAVYGGRYSLKSHTVARVLLIRARQEKLRIGCFREFQNSIAESSHQLLKDLIAQYELFDFKVTDKSIYNSVTGSDFIFKGLHHNDQNIKSTEGIDIAWVEEAQAVSKESIEILTPTVRKEGSQIIYTYNRLLEDDPVHVRLVIEGRPNTLVIKVNYDTAQKYGFIPDAMLREIEDDRIYRPALYKHKWLGEPVSLERQIYRDWRIFDSIPFGARLERRYVDFGYTNDPTACGEIWYYDGAWIANETLYTKGLSNKQIANHFLSLEKPQTLIIADSAEPKSIDELRGYGLNVAPCEKGKDSVRNGIQLVQDQPIGVTSSSTNIIRERQRYFWLVDKNGKILNEEDPTCDNHHMSGIRYALSSLHKLSHPETYWDKVWADELRPPSQPNLER